MRRKGPGEPKEMLPADESVAGGGGNTSVTAARKHAEHAALAAAGAEAAARAAIAEAAARAEREAAEAAAREEVEAAARAAAAQEAARAEREVEAAAKAMAGREAEAAAARAKLADEDTSGGENGGRRAPAGSEGAAPQLQKVKAPVPSAGRGPKPHGGAELEDGDEFEDDDEFEYKDESKDGDEPEEDHKGDDVEPLDMHNFSSKPGRKYVLFGDRKWGSRFNELMEPGNVKFLQARMSRAFQPKGDTEADKKPTEVAIKKNDDFITVTLMILGKEKEILIKITGGKESLSLMPAHDKLTQDGGNSVRAILVILNAVIGKSGGKVRFPKCWTSYDDDDKVLLLRIIEELDMAGKNLRPLMINKDQFDKLVEDCQKIEQKIEQKRKHELDKAYGVEGKTDSAPGSVGSTAVRDPEHTGARRNRSRRAPPGEPRLMRQRQHRPASNVPASGVKAKSPLGEGTQIRAGVT